VESEGCYEWKIENWNQLAEEEYSPEFEINNHKWLVHIYIFIIYSLLKLINNFFNYFLKKKIIINIKYFITIGN